MSKELYLCGTVHVDFQGPRRLNKVLSHIRPEIIAIEALPEDAEKIVEKRKKWGKWILVN